MNIQDALKSFTGNAFRITNYGTRDFARWMFWDAKTSEYVVLMCKEDNQLGKEIYRGTDEEIAVYKLTHTMREVFVNKPA